MYSILLVEDNEAIQELNKELLEEVGGYSVQIAMNLAEARDSLSKHTPDLIVLDIMLPDGSGLDYLKEIKQQHIDMPVLLLTALSESGDEVKGLRDGGDDYIAKPYDRDVLLMRIAKLLSQRARTDERIKEAAIQGKSDAQKEAEVMVYGPLTVNHITKRAYLFDEDAGLTPKEFSLLAYFLKNIGKQLTTEEIYEAVWGLDAMSSAGTVRVRIKGLRDKLRMDDEVAVAIDTVERKYYVCRLTASNNTDIF